ncbi:branched-chain amino acid ABC transporter permease [Archaeoglobus profundus]|uniref:Inner-membrane translocator n=1 Tax=Archaeoglobus profundus (strain DSM 5631 / JCM 9629 / NBRC 100127 / Av18) TaxID=572546 RepID=D2RFJ4_ARCPA|nr:branched-chain amino acid ABC transporter permease [Archaeoglobus profundus]ADB58888.1 inner-membrane translocator [Archaeoglobus profundus DSM 5631]
MIDIWIDCLISGILLGLVYGLAAIGLNLIFGVMRVINLSHGAFIALGMFVAYYLFTYGLNPYLGVPAIFGLGLFLGMVTYFVALHRVIDAPELSTLLSTFSVSLFIIGVGTFVWTTIPYAIDIDLGYVAIGNVTILGTKVATGVISVILTALLYIFLYRTKLGKAVRAVSMNRTAAELMGINTTKILALSFGIGVALAMTAGALIATIFPFTILSGGVYELKSFVICVLGGLGNPLGALVGGLVLGIIENVATMQITTGLVPFIEFAILVAVLVLKPRGLLGGEV